MLQSLVYMSSATRPFDEDDLAAVLDQARTRNTEAGLSGLLVYRDGRFMQLLEGPYDAVLATYGRILEDDRHDDVALLVEESIHTRRFPDWSMAYDTGEEHAVPEGFSDFLATGDGSGDTSRARALLRWFRTHPLAAPEAAKGKHRRDA